MQLVSEDIDALLGRTKDDRTHWKVKLKLLDVPVLPPKMDLILGKIGMRGVLKRQLLSPVSFHNLDKLLDMVGGKGIYQRDEVLEYLQRRYVG